VQFGLVLGAVLAAEGLAAQTGAARRAQVVECAKCHANHDFIAGKGKRPGEDSLLFVPANALAGTVHDTLKCVSCHRGYEAGYPHQVQNVVVPCQTCHDQAGRDWNASIHASNAATKGDAPTCVGCHGAHKVYKRSDPKSPTYVLNVAAMCGRCHGDPRIIGAYFAGPRGAQARIAVAAFPHSVHGAALTRDGLVVSATCFNCHTAHKILPADSAASSVNRANIPATCGKCHAGIIATFDSSAHGVAYPAQPGASDHKRPVCSDCHSAHGIVRANQPEWLLGTVETCGKCHEKLYETYLETYHGQVTKLGFGLVAKCSDCHTPHNMRPASDVKSSVFAGNLVATCKQCHPAANANFVKYYAHPDPTQRTKYPSLYWSWLGMTMLLLGTMTVFGIHTALWLTREVIERRRKRRAAGAGSTP
jgi:nitrate/TMAO reductase-like tetraheme cytochrome c subunit